MYTQYFIFMYEFFYSNNAIYHFIDETIIVHIYWVSVQYDILYIFYLLFLFIHLYIQQIFKKKKGFTELNSLSCIHVYLYIVNKILFLQFLFQNSAKPWDQEEAAGGLVCPGAGLSQAEQILQCRCDRDSVCAPVL